jgi:hypothetical protein
MAITVSRTVPDPVAASDHWRLHIHRHANGTSEVVLTYFPTDGGKPFVATLNDSDITAGMRTAGAALFNAILPVALTKFQERG